MRIALATCRHPVSRDTDFDFIAPALRRRGVEVEAPVWNDEGVDWSGFDLVMPSSTWDYHRSPAEFRSWLRRVAELSRPCNQIEALEWGLDKRYLERLERAGVPIVPTIWTEPGSEDAIERTVAELGWGDVIVKPVVDLGAERLARVETAMVARILVSLAEAGMVQPYLGSVEGAGELSLVLIDGEPVHAIRKRPAPGDFRVQQQYGGSAESVPPPANAVEIGRRALEAVPGQPLYARLDLLSDDEGELRVIELELVEPRLYLELEPRSAELLARRLQALAAR